MYIMVNNFTARSPWHSVYSLHAIGPEVLTDANQLGAARHLNRVDALEELDLDATRGVGRDEGAVELALARAVLVLRAGGSQLKGMGAGIRGVPGSQAVGAGVGYTALLGGDDEVGGLRRVDDGLDHVERGGGVALGLLGLKPHHVAVDMGGLWAR